MARDPQHLPEYGRWHWLWRSTFHAAYRGDELVVDVDYFDLSERIRLYRDGEFLAARSSPATLRVDERVRVVAAMSLYGMKYVRLEFDDGRDPVPFAPGPRTGEARRRRFATQHPVVDRVFSVLSWTVLVVALLTQVPELVSLVGGWVGISVPTFELPGRLNLTLQIAGVLAGLDRALRMKYNRWLDEDG